MNEEGNYFLSVIGKATGSIKTHMSREAYQELIQLVEVFTGCSADGEEIWCFNLIKEIVDGALTREEIGRERKIVAQKQLNESYEWLRSIGITTHYQEEILSVIS